MADHSAVYKLEQHLDQVRAEWPERYGKALDLASALESRATAAEQRVRELEGALTVARQVIVAACGEKAPYARIAIKQIDRALSPEVKDG